jgi:hypothetical protein
LDEIFGIQDRENDLLLATCNSQNVMGKKIEIGVQKRDKRLAPIRTVEATIH